METGTLSSTVEKNKPIDEKKVKDLVDKLEDTKKEGNKETSPNVIKRGSQTKVVKQYKPSLFLPEADYKKLKDYCTATGETIQAALYNCVKEWLDEIIFED